MTATASASVCERLRAESADIWAGLHEHPFIRELAAGTLLPDRFRFYVEQNLMYLAEYARALALGASKAEDEATMALFSRDVANILEREIPENRELLRRAIALGAEDRAGTVCMAPANVAYTSFLVSTALARGPLEIMAAIVPCTWTYGEIASTLITDGLVHDHPVYAEWIRFFGLPTYGGVVAAMRADLEAMAAGADEGELERLSGLFRTSVRLELRFWDMAYALDQWPDVRARHPLPEAR
jgi:thiaminase/transcriptional activator TenA